MIRALVFDFDGLILDTETPVIEAWMALHQEAGLPHSRDYAAQIVGHIDVDFDPWVAFGAGVDRKELEEEHRKRSRLILARQEVLPGVRTLIESAKRQGLRLGIASNSTHAWVDNHLKRLGLFDHFDTIKTRDDVARGKPDPEMYEAALTTLGVSAKEAIAFEDSTPGSHAAKRAGLWCVAVPNPSTLQHDFEHADLKLNSMAEITLEMLLARFGGG